jgi:RNA polymerase sigma-70 factor (ECF subfamily)
MTNRPRNQSAGPQEGERAGLDAIMPALYAELRRLAGACMQRERPDHTLQTTALVHEAYLRLRGQETVDWKNRAHVLALAARMMRRILTDYADARNRKKRPWKLSRAPLDEDVSSTPPPAVDFIDLDRALRRLAELDPQQASVVELRFFGGLTIQEAAEALGISEATVEREWSTARLWLLHRIGGGKPAP